MSKTAYFVTLFLPLMFEGVRYLFTGKEKVDEFEVKEQISFCHELVLPGYFNKVQNCLRK